MLSKSNGNVYYVDTNNGNNDNDGSINNPWKTIQKAANIMIAGDKCLIREGKYRECITPANSGLENSPIKFEAYFDKEKEKYENVIVSGCDKIDSKKWEQYENYIYKTEFKSSMKPGRDQVFVDDKVIVQARYPNQNSFKHGYFNTQVPLSPLFPVLGDFIAGTKTEEHKFKSWSLLEQPNDYWKGALYNGGHYWGWAWQSGDIIKSQVGEITTNHDTNQWDFRKDEYIKDGREEMFRCNQNGYITNTIKALNYPGAWHYEDGFLYLSLQDKSSPINHQVEIKQRMLGFDLSQKEYIELKGITLFACSVTMFKANFCCIDNCLMSYISHYLKWDDSRDGYIDDFQQKVLTGPPQKGEVGIYVSGQENKIKNSVICHSAGAGLFLAGLNTHVINNTIHDCGYQGTYLGPILITWEPETSYNTPRGGHIIKQNHIYNFGRAAIGFNSIPGKMNHTEFHGCEISGNTIHDGMLLANDGALIYSWFVKCDAYNKSTNIHQNIIYNSAVEENKWLIYLDDETSGINVYNNILGKLYPPVYSAKYTYYKNTDVALISNNITVNPFKVDFREAEKSDELHGCDIMDCVKASNGKMIGYCDGGNYVTLYNVDLSEITTFTARVAVPEKYSGQSIEIQLFGGEKIASLTIENTGSWDHFVEQSTAITKPKKGIYNIYIYFKGSFGVGNFDWFRFDSRPIVDFREAENCDELNGCVIMDCAKAYNGKMIGQCDEGKYVVLYNVDLSEITTFTARVAVPKQYSGKRISIQLFGGEEIASLTIENTGSWDHFVEQSTAITNQKKGFHNIYIYFKGGAGVGNFDWFRFDSRPIVNFREAQNCDELNGCVIMDCAKASNGKMIGQCDEGKYVVLYNVDLSEITTFTARVAVPVQYSGKSISIQISEKEVIGSLTIESTGSWDNFVEQSTAITNQKKGFHNIYIYFKGGAGVGNFDWFRFD